LAVVAHIAFERRAHLRRQQLVVLRVLGETVVAGEIVQGDVVSVYPVAWGNVLRGEADDLPEFPDRLVLAGRGDGQLVAARAALACGEGSGLRALGDLVDRDDHIVVWREADDAGIGHGCWSEDLVWLGLYPAGRRALAASNYTPRKWIKSRIFVLV